MKHVEMLSVHVCSESWFGPSDGARQSANNECSNHQISGRNQEAEGGAAETGLCISTHQLLETITVHILIMCSPGKTEVQCRTCQDIMIQIISLGSKHGSVNPQIIMLVRV